MTTVSHEIAYEVIAGHGYYEDDPRVLYVLRYTNQFNGGDAYKLIYSEEHLERCYAPDSAMIAPVVIWKAGCSVCEESGSFKPSHEGSISCQSGSLASGGSKSHCTCDTCF